MLQTRILISAALTFATGSAAQAAVVISSAATQNISCSGGVCAPTATDAVLNVNDLENFLASGNIEVTTTGSGVQSNDIQISDALTWSTANTLALDSYHSITINRTVSVAGQGGLSLTTNDGGSGGVLAFGRKGHTTFQNLSSRLTINGTPYALVNSVQSLAGAVAANPSGAYALANSYDASQDGAYNSAPVSAALSGSLEGLGNTISHLAINGTGYIGLFEVVSGLAENLSVLNVDFTVSGGSQAGAFAGVAYNVSRVHVSGTIRGEGDMGNDIGGLTAIGGKLIGCSADMRIIEDQTSAIGGLAGSGDVDDGFATGSISAAGERSVVGGLVSYNEGDIQNSYATTAVRAGVHSWLGGLTGTNGQGRQAWH